MRRDDRRAWRLGAEGHWRASSRPCQASPGRHLRDAHGPGRGIGAGGHVIDTDGRGQAPTAFAARSGPASPPTPREVELKYLVRDVEALRGWLAHELGRRPGRRRERQRAHRRGRGPLHRHGLRRPGAGRLRGPTATRGRRPGQLTVKSTSRDRPAAARPRRATRRTRGALAARRGRGAGRRAPGPGRLAGQRRPRARQRGARRRPAADALHHQPAPRAAHARPGRRGPCRSRSTGSRCSGVRARWPPSPCWRWRPATASAPAWPAWRRSSRPPASSRRSRAPRRRSRAPTWPRRRRTRPTACPSCPPRRASRRTTHWARPAARCCACTWRGCSPSRPARAPARTSRTSTRCAWRHAGCARPGASSTAPTGPSCSAATWRSCAPSPTRSGRCATSTCCSSTWMAHAARLPAAGQEAIEPLRGAWRRQREAARGRLVALLDSRAVPRLRRGLPGLHRVARRR